jgi:hypothetical protein
MIDTCTTVVLTDLFVLYKPFSRQFQRENSILILPNNHRHHAIAIGVKV